MWMQCAATSLSCSNPVAVAYVVDFMPACVLPSMQEVMVLTRPETTFRH